MVEKFLSATADYLKFTFGAMLLATVAFFFYAYIFANGLGPERHQDFDTVLNSIEISVLSICALKLLTGFFSNGERIAARLGEGIGFQSLSYIDRVILSVASVFLSIDLLMTLMATLISNHHEGVEFKKRR